MTRARPRALGPVSPPDAKPHGHAASVSPAADVLICREGDPEGVAYWAKKLDEDYSKAELLAFFAEAEENVQSTAPVTDTGILFN